jgi:hypothetical protein
VRGSFLETLEHPQLLTSGSGILSGIRTTLDIADEVINALMARYPDASKTEAIEIAISAHLSQDAAAWLRAQAGTVPFDEAAWHEARTAERRRAAERIEQP